MYIVLISLLTTNAHIWKESCLGDGTPGRCCDEFRCESGEDGQGADAKRCPYADKMYDDGDTWHSSSCEQCRCRGGIALCSKMTCANPPCMFYLLYLFCNLELKQNWRNKEVICFSDVMLSSSSYWGIGGTRRRVVYGIIFHVCLFQHIVLGWLFRKMNAAQYVLAVKRTVRNAKETKHGRKMIAQGD